ncbi:hypothetical protein NEOLEDRAFT_1243457 [Neolentinus lepideus HHB14362 ss-1]|uniref:BAG domain-containing protein n=1 Tax=Neolentinus lepideus HHB14362 ss-1 TaxID=1314782 RepID=A0A165QWI6_9AGAM|nr:hypothetical protein NEOLEDRAFT_1243457 [Neolentinus lepideus HHB14362 ss-1]
MFGYSPYRDSFRSSYASDPYYRALAEEQAARNQYVAALRAQEEARERAARARRLQEAYRPYASPYNLYYDEEEDENPCYANPYNRGYGGYDPYEMDLERRRRELLLRERELAMQRQREREMERTRMLEAERRRRELAAAEEEKERRRRAEAAAQDFFRNYERGRMFSDEQAYRDKMGHKRSTSTFPNSGTGFPKPNPQTRSARSPNPRRPASAQPSEKTRIPIRTPSPKPAQNQPKPSSPKPQYTKEQVEAAERIQAFVRTHYLRRRALHQISQIEAHFDSLKSSFSFPAVIDFSLSPSSEESIVSVDTTTLSPLPPSECASVPPPSLPYTPHNTSLHAYDHNLGEILSRLDEVQSGGDVKVRERRKEVVRKVQEEQARLEEWRVGLWAAWVKQNVKKQEAEDNDGEDREAVMDMHGSTELEISQPESRMEVEETSSAPQQDHTSDVATTSQAKPSTTDEPSPSHLEQSSEVPQPESKMEVEGSSPPPALVQLLTETSPSPSPSVGPESQSTGSSSPDDLPSIPPEAEVHADHFARVEVNSPVSTHPSDDGFKVEYIEDVPVAGGMDVDERDLPEPPVKITVEDVVPLISENNVEDVPPPDAEMDVDEGRIPVQPEEQPVVEVPLASTPSSAISEPSQEVPETTSPVEVGQQLVSSPRSDAEESSSEPETEAPQTPPPSLQTLPDLQVKQASESAKAKVSSMYSGDERSVDEFVML